MLPRPSSLPLVSGVDREHGRCSHHRDHQPGDGRHSVVEQPRHQRDHEEARERQQFGTDGPQQQTVGSPPECLRRRCRAPAGERVGNLTDDDCGERCAGGGHQCVTGRERVARPPSGGDERDHER